MNEHPLGLKKIEIGRMDPWETLNTISDEISERIGFLEKQTTDNMVYTFHGIIGEFNKRIDRILNLKCQVNALDVRNYCVHRYEIYELEYMLEEIMPLICTVGLGIKDILQENEAMIEEDID